MFENPEVLASAEILMGKLSSLQKPQREWELLLMAIDNSRSNSWVKVSFPKQTLPLKPPPSFAKLSPTDIPHVGKIEPGSYSGRKRQRVSLQHPRDEENTNKTSSRPSSLWSSCKGATATLADKRAVTGMGYLGLGSASLRLLLGCSSECHEEQQRHSQVSESSAHATPQCQRGTLHWQRGNTRS